MLLVSYTFLADFFVSLGFRNKMPTLDEQYTNDRKPYISICAHTVKQENSDKN